MTTHRHRTRLGFLFANNQHVRNLLYLGISDFAANFFVTVVNYCEYRQPKAPIAIAPQIPETFRK